MREEGTTSSDGGDGRVVYRPTCHYAYHPCNDCILSLYETNGSGVLPARKHILMAEEIVSGNDDGGRCGTALDCPSKRPVVSSRARLQRDCRSRRRCWCRWPWPWRIHARDTSRPRRWATSDACRSKGLSEGPHHLARRRIATKVIPGNSQTSSRGRETSTRSSGAVDTEEITGNHYISPKYNLI